MYQVKAKAKIKKGKLKAEVKHPLAGGVEPGSASKLKTLANVPVGFVAKFLGILRLKKKDGK